MSGCGTEDVQADEYGKAAALRVPLMDLTVRGWQQTWENSPGWLVSSERTRDHGRFPCLLVPRGRTLRQPSQRRGTERLMGLITPPGFWGQS